MPKLFSAPDNSRVARVALWGGREVAVLALASFIAGLATMPYAAFHFHRITPFGVLANLAAMPVVSALVMPAGVAGTDRNAVRIRWRVLASDGLWHWLDDCRVAVGSCSSRGYRPDGGIQEPDR